MLMVIQDLGIKLVRLLFALARVARHHLVLLVAWPAHRRRSGEGPGRSHLGATPGTNCGAVYASSELMVSTAVPRSRV